MELHRILTFAGVILLVATFALNSEYGNAPFNYAYITGVAMLASFSISFIIFTKDKLNA